MHGDSSLSAPGQYERVKTASGFDETCTRVRRYRNKWKTAHIFQWPELADRRDNPQGGLDEVGIAGPTHCSRGSGVEVGEKGNGSFAVPGTVNRVAWWTTKLHGPALSPAKVMLAGSVRAYTNI